MNEPLATYLDAVTTALKAAGIDHSSSTAVTDDDTPEALLISLGPIGADERPILQWEPGTGWRIQILARCVYRPGTARYVHAGPLPSPEYVAASVARWMSDPAALSDVAPAYEVPSRTVLELALAQAARGANAPLEVAVKAADIIATQGWAQDGNYVYRPDLPAAQCPVDLQGALALAAGVDIHDHVSLDTPTGLYGEAMMLVARHVLAAACPQDVVAALAAVTDWQDDKGRTAAQVIAALRGAAAAASGDPGPHYPRHGAPIPDRPGYLVAQCGHSLAESEWRTGFRTCERCPSGAQQSGMPDDPRPGELYSGRDRDLLFCIAREDGIGFVTNRGTWVPREEAEQVYAPLTLLRPVTGETPEQPPLIVAAPTEQDGGAQ